MMLLTNLTTVTISRFMSSLYAVHLKLIPCCRSTTSQKEWGENHL